MLTQGLQRASQTKPKGISTRDGARTFTWPETLQRITRFAAALRRAGIKAGDRVAILALNSDRYLEHFYAVAWAGAVTVPINTRLAAPEISYILSDSGAALLLIDDNFIPMLALLSDSISSLRAIVSLSDAVPRDGVLSYESLIFNESPMDQIVRSGADLAGIFYTGGTTGKPKGVMLSHSNLVINALNGTQNFGEERDSVFLHASPMFHLGDGAWTFAITMLGGTHCFIPKFDPTHCLNAIKEQGITDTMLVPTMITKMLNDPDIRNYDLSRLRQVIFGAAPMPDATLHRAIELWPNTRFVTGWGMTELSPIGTVLPARFNSPEHIASGRYKSCGQAAFSVEIVIADECGQEVPRGSVGEIIARGPSVMQGYWNNPEATAETIRDGWLHSGDAGWMDDEGFIYIVGRMKDMIISGGENIFPSEVENAILTFDGVADCAVIGIPDDLWGESVHAIIVRSPEHFLQSNEIIEHCQQRIAKFKCPRSIEFRDEPLPLSAAGKVLKAPLREPFWADRQKLVN